VEEDVRFILIHHTESRNDYRRDETPDEIRAFYRLHTGPRRGWPDVAYNFLVDRHGRIWEGRAGSLDGAVRGDATGGSQGYAQLCALIGDHHTEPVSAAASAALIRLVAWLGARHSVDTNPDRTVRFVSRGSSRWPTGTNVVTSTIAGHRDMSITSCPGDAAYTLITERLAAAATELRLQTGRRVTVDGNPVSAGNEIGGEGSEDEAGARRGDPAGPTHPGDPMSRTSDPGAEAEAGEHEGSPNDHSAPIGIGAAGTAALAAMGALVALRRRRST
jgi:MYXO-CTERM domain-containing protein